MKITLRAARVHAGMTQEEVAKKLGKSNKTIVNWENGKTTIDSANFEALSRLYEIPVDNILLPTTSR